MVKSKRFLIEVAKALIKALVKRLFGLYL